MKTSCLLKVLLIIVVVVVALNIFGILDSKSIMTGGEGPGLFNPDKVIDLFVSVDDTDAKHEYVSAVVRKTLNPLIRKMIQTGSTLSNVGNDQLDGAISKLSALIQDDMDLGPMRFVGLLEKLVQRSKQLGENTKLDMEGLEILDMLLAAQCGGVAC